MFWLPRGHFSMSFGSQEVGLSCFNQQGDSLVYFANQEGTLVRFFGSQEGTLAHVVAPRRAL